MYEIKFLDLKYELKKCRECSCSRCNLNGTNECYIEIAIKELDRYEHAFDVMEKNNQAVLKNALSYIGTDGTDPNSVKEDYYARNF